MAQLVKRIAEDTCFLAPGPYQFRDNVMTFEVKTIQIALFPLRFSLPKNIGGPSEGRSNGAPLCPCSLLVHLLSDPYIRWKIHTPNGAARATRLHVPLRRRGHYGGSGGARRHCAACARPADMAAGTRCVVGSAVWPVINLLFISASMPWPLAPCAHTGGCRLMSMRFIWLL